MTLYDKQIVIVDRTNWHVILRHHQEGKIVLYDPQSCNIAVTTTSPTAQLGHYAQKSNSLSASIVSVGATQIPHPHDRCPYCNQLLPSNGIPSSDIGNDNNAPKPPVSPVNTSPFRYAPLTSKDYFLLLGNQLQRETNQNAAPSSYDPLSSDSLNTSYYKRFFHQEKKIGSGGFGSVFLCRHVINDTDLGLFAVKKVPVGDNKPWLAKVLKEVRALVTLAKHPNIIHYQHCWLEFDKCADFGPEIPCLFILMEFANGGNLADAIWSKPNTWLSEDQIWKYFADICEGLNYLHQCGIVHRDIKPHNILLDHIVDSHGQLQTRLIISDFGTCTQNSEPPVKRTGNTGTMEYIAPELMKPDSSGMYRQADSKCDIWSLGVILYAMSFSRLPFAHDLSDKDSLINEISNFMEVDFPPNPKRSDALLKLISMLLRGNPEERPSTSEILRIVSNRQIPDIISPRSSCEIVKVPTVNENLNELDEDDIRVPPHAVPARNVIKLPPPQLPATAADSLFGDLLKTIQTTIINPLHGIHVKTQSSTAKMAFIKGTQILLFIFKVWILLNTFNPGVSNTLYFYLSLGLSMGYILSDNLSTSMVYYLFTFLLGLDCGYSVMYNNPTATWGLLLLHVISLVISVSSTYAGQPQLATLSRAVAIKTLPPIHPRHLH